MRELREALQLSIGYFGFFRLTPRSQVSRVGHESPFFAAREIRLQGFGEADLIRHTIQIGSAFNGVFSYADICEMDYDMILELARAAKEVTRGS